MWVQVAILNKEVKYQEVHYSWCRIRICNCSYTIVLPNLQHHPIKCSVWTFRIKVTFEKLSLLVSCGTLPYQKKCINLLKLVLEMTISQKKKSQEGYFKSKLEKIFSKGDYKLLINLTKNV